MYGIVETITLRKPMLQRRESVNNKITIEGENHVNLLSKKN